MAPLNVPRFHEFVASYVEIHNLTAFIDEESGEDHRFEMSEAWLKACLWIERNQNNKRLLLMAFRGFGKSHLACLYIVWNLLKNPNFTAVIVCADTELATKRAGFIRTVLERHPLCRHLVPNKDNGAEAGLREKWTRNSFTVVRPATIIEDSVAALGLEAQLTGNRGDLILADDVEVAKNTRSAKQRKDLRDRIREFVPLAKRQILYIGTPWSHDSIYPWLADKLKYKTIKFPLYTEQDGVRTYTWLTKCSGDEQVQAIIQESGSIAYFESQYLLIPVSDGGSVLPTNMIREYTADIEVDPTQTRRRVLTLNGHRLLSLLAAWDTAPGLPGGDDSILAIVAKDEKDNTYVHRVIRLPPITEDEGWRPQTRKIMEVCRDLGVNRLLVEANNNPTIVKELKDAGNELKVRLSIEKFNAVTNKKKRIQQALEVPMASGRFYCHTSVVANDDEPGLFLIQAEAFPSCVESASDHDDAIDAVASGVSNLNHGQGRFDLGGTERILGVRNQPETHRVVATPRLGPSTQPRRWG